MSVTRLRGKKVGVERNKGAVCMASWEVTRRCDNGPRWPTCCSPFSNNSRVGSGFWCLGVIGSGDQTKKGRLQEACLTRRASLHKSTLTCCAFKYPTCKGFNCWGLEVTQMRVPSIESGGQALASHCATRGPDLFTCFKPPTIAQTVPLQSSSG